MKHPVVQYPLQRVDRGHLYQQWEDNRAGHLHQREDNRVRHLYQRVDNRAGHLYQVVDKWVWFQEEGMDTMLHKQEGDYSQDHYKQGEGFYLC